MNPSAEAVLDVLSQTQLDFIEQEFGYTKEAIAAMSDDEIDELYDQIADIEVGSVFVGILLRNGYLFYLSRTEPLKTCIYTHGGWGSISEISPRGIAGHIGRELHGKLGDHTAVD